MNSQLHGLLGGGALLEEVVTGDMPLKTLSYPQALPLCLPIIPEVSSAPPPSAQKQWSQAATD
jgi:hypothetical protein